MSQETKTNYVQHFSTRIPWKDNDYSGRIDDNPKLNVACQIIPNIASSRDLEFEENNKGKSYKEVDSSTMKDWITENAAFMSKDKLSITMNHPYARSKKNKKFQHFIETPFEMKPYSFLLRPFSWMLKENAEERQNYHNFFFDLDETEKMLDWKSAWVSHGKSQKGIFDYFYSGLTPNESLIFPYYKQVPFIEDGRRVIAGIGNIISDVEYKQYATDGTSEEKNYIWETNAAHSIRTNGKNGFLMPYQEIIEYVKEHPDFDINSVTLFEADGFREEFSYAAEWVSYDAAIDVLNQAKTVLKNIADMGLEKANREWANTQLEYVETQLKAVWKQRGIFPGLGSALSAFGVKYGFDIAKYIDTSNHNLIPELTFFFTGEKITGDKKLDSNIVKKQDEFRGLLKNKDKVKLFELLSRVNLSVEQAKNIWETLKDKAEIIIENPYLLYELTRKEEECKTIAISKVDNAMFVNEYVNNNHPIQDLIGEIFDSDKRRFRAMTIHVLENVANQGHTFLKYDKVIVEIQKLPLDYETNFSIEKIEGITEFLEEGDLYIDEKEQYIKLSEYQEYKEAINDAINHYLEDDLSYSQNWNDIIVNQLRKLKDKDEINDKAINEQAEALEKLEKYKLSILTGGAGTGKTTVLGIFASSDEIQKGGVLALAPTGKARVQLENSFRDNKVDAEFMTIAQFLNNSGGFNGKTMTYCMPTKESSSQAKTVIIDESSMLTENMFAGILKLIDTHASRIVFVGDPNQLPPIGAGCPFVDLFHFLEKNHPEKIAKLNTPVRQDREGDDLRFAQLFGEFESDKEVIYKIQNGETDKRLKYIQYSDLDELEEKFFEQIEKITANSHSDDLIGFNKSLGSTGDEKADYSTSEHIEDWQILSPNRTSDIGSDYLNNQIHQKYRQKTVDSWNAGFQCKPQSIQSIVYGDKVISNTNGKRWYWLPKPGGEEYIANGEIGIMAYYKYVNKNTQYYNFRFSSFEGKVFTYKKDDFGGEESSSKLELAYALTIHKSQGSTFGETIVVINGKSPLLSKELLYTAFSRQKDKLTILSDLSVQELVKYSSDWYSDTKRRFTDLFEKPDYEKVFFGEKSQYFGQNRIHTTNRGEMVRSKSEVIVANILDSLDLDYEYEKELPIDGIDYLPDFTINYHGKKAYLEHLGMLGIDSYRERNKKKLEKYEKNDISEARGNLIITEDGLDGSIDSNRIMNMIKKWMSES